MGQAFAGKSAVGSGVTYTIPPGSALRLELLTFTLTTDATAGVHSPVVTIFDAALSAVTARLWDWNEGGPNMTLFYTYGIGLQPFNCTVTTGMMIEHDLPDCWIAAASTITLTAVNSAGVTIGGDTFTGVTLFGEYAGAAASPPVTAPPDPFLVPAGG